MERNIKTTKEIEEQKRFAEALRLNIQSINQSINDEFDVIRLLDSLLKGNTTRKKEPYTKHIQKKTKPTNVKVKNGKTTLCNEMRASLDESIANYTESLAMIDTIVELFSQSKETDPKKKDTIDYIINVQLTELKKMCLKKLEFFNVFYSKLDELEDIEKQIQSFRRRVEKAKSGEPISDEEYAEMKNRQARLGKRIEEIENELLLLKR